MLMGYWSMLWEREASQRPQDRFLATCPTIPTLSLLLITPGRGLAAEMGRLGRCQVVGGAPRRAGACPAQLQIAKENQ